MAETRYVIQARYQPGSTLAEALGTDWHDVGISKPGVTQKQAEAELERTQAAFATQEQLVEHQLVEREI